MSCGLGTNDILLCHTEDKFQKKLDQIIMDVVNSNHPTHTTQIMVVQTADSFASNLNLSLYQERGTVTLK